MDQRPDSGSPSKNIVAVWRNKVAVWSKPKASQRPVLMVSDVAMPSRGRYPWFAAAFKPAQGPRMSPGPGACHSCSPDVDTSWDTGSNLLYVACSGAPGYSGNGVTGAIPTES
jgi:hypothetical protein